MTVTQSNKGPVTGNSDSESRGQIQGGGVLISRDLLDDDAVQALAPDVYRRKFLAAIDGEQNEFSKYIRRDVAKAVVS